MNNAIKTITIGELILNSQTPNREKRFEHYLIPYYQRGYRWGEIEVLALLDDIHNFMKNRKSKEMYCLQPIVITPQNDANGFNEWEVIDGQQRLITLFLIFQAIQKPKYNIHFGQRTKSNEFLEELCFDKYNHDEPDFHFMSEAHRVVSKWFDIHKKNDISFIDEFYTTITKKVQVIWYQVEIATEDEKINTFNRLNIGRIPLTDAELIRALLLSKIKFGLSEREMNMRQSEIANEWSTIEYELQNKELWYFLKNDKKSDKKTCIELIFNLIAGETAKNYSTYLWFEKEIGNDDNAKESDNALELWSKVKSIFAKFKSWYNDRTLYHYIGYLLTTGETLKTLLNASRNKTKKEFKEWLIATIVELLKDVNIEALEYGKPNTRNVLLLFNVLTVEALLDTPQNRFPFNHYKSVENENGGWSIEHIHAQQSEDPIKDKKAMLTWLEETLKELNNISDFEVEKEDDDGNYIKEIVPISEFVSRIDCLINQKDSINQDEFNKLRSEIIEKFDAKSVHELDNLALLSKRNNSALNKSIFPVKRSKIIELEKEGWFIPPCTRNVFLKYYSESDTQPYYWSSNDKKAYFATVKEVLSPFLTL